MLSILGSNATSSNKRLRNVTRRTGEDNGEWLARNLTEGSGTDIVLLGGSNEVSFRLRTTQAHVRHDLHPSHWSHVLLLDKPSKKIETSSVYEISLDPAGGFDFPAPTNGIQKEKFRPYLNPTRYPNIAVLKVPVAQKEVLIALERFQLQRAVLDSVELIVHWLAFVWGVARTPNPLLENRGIPSSAMLEVIFGAAGYDLTPGLESRSSCPEAIWQAAKWWHEYYEKQDREPLTGAYYYAHKL
jgi:hypothetical protein